MKNILIALSFFMVIKMLLHLYCNAGGHFSAYLLAVQHITSGSSFILGSISFNLIV